MSDLIFTLPIEIKFPKQKSFVLNLNQYRRRHYRVLNNAKIIFTDIVIKQEVPKYNYPFDKIHITYKYYPKTKALYDSMNIAAVVDKFFMDVLVKKKIIKDDNYKIVEFPNFIPMPCDKNNPRIEAYIKKIN